MSRSRNNSSTSSFKPLLPRTAKGLKDRDCQSFLVSVRVLIGFDSRYGYCMAVETTSLTTFYPNLTQRKKALRVCEPSLTSYYRNRSYFYLGWVHFVRRTVFVSWLGMFNSMGTVFASSLGTYRYGYCICVLIGYVYRMGTVFGS